MKDAAEARQWLTDNLTSRHDERPAFYAGLAEYIRRLPDTDPELARATTLLITYDHGPGRRPDISLSGDDEDTADVIGEVLDDDEMRLTSQGADDGCYGSSIADDAGILPAHSYAAFLHGLLDRTEQWLADDAGDDRSAG
jgi:hypothetical protein